MDHVLCEWHRWVSKVRGKQATSLNLFSACVVGSSIICVDLIVRHIPGKSNFRIQDSNIFLSSSLSLSFGVMVSPSLYGRWTPLTDTGA